MKFSIINIQEIFFKEHFFKLLIGITISSFLIRFVNTTYASMWSDELYSMLSVHPDNSMYENLLLQRRDQPPLYFVLLKLWVFVFGYNDFSARILSVLLGTASVFIMGFVNRKIFNEKIALLSAFITAFSLTQIEYSLEARFYILVFLLVTCSFYTFWLTQKNNSHWLLHLVHGGFCAAIILAHHFGAFVVLAYGLFDLAALIQIRFQFKRFFKIAIGYLFCLLIIGVWFYWSFIKLQTVSDYWLKVIDLKAYLLFNLKYNIISLVASLVLTAFGIAVSGMLKQRFVLLLMVQCALVVVVPLAFSYAVFPILVDRYAFPLAPALHSLMAIGLVYITERVGKLKMVLAILICLLLAYDGVYHSLINKKRLDKEPWNQMADWIKKQPGYPNIPVYTTGIIVNGRFTIDYYLPERRVTSLLYDSSGLDKHKRFYLVETNGHDYIPKPLKQNIDARFQKKEVLFGYDAYGKGGVITIYEPLQKK